MTLDDYLEKYAGKLNYLQNLFIREIFYRDYGEPGLDLIVPEVPIDREDGSARVWRIDFVVTSPNNKKYGRVAVMVNFLCFTKYLFDIGAENFTPAPRVESGLVLIEPRDRPIFDIDLKMLEKVAGVAFNQRRKMLRSSLKSLSGYSEEWAQNSGVDFSLRAENLSLEDFANLVRSLELLK